MATAFVGQMLTVAFNFAPTGYAIAAGQLLPISQNTALFSLLGTQFGGDGKSTFALPNMQDNIAVGSGQLLGGSDYFIGEQSGTSTVTLLTSEMPAHTHSLHADNAAGNATTPVNNALARSATTSPYVPGNSQTNQVLSLNAVAVAGGSLPHNNMMPYLVINWLIALQGVYPARS